MGNPALVTYLKGRMMKTGAVIRLTHFVHHTTEIQLTYKAPKKAVFVAVLLGVEARDGTEPLSVIDAFAKMGWQPNPEQFDEETLAQIKEMHEITD